MKKKIGEVVILDKNNNNRLSTLPIWGTLFKTDNNKLMGGIYFSFKYSDFDEYTYLIKRVIQRIPDFKLSFHNEFYGEYFTIGVYGNPDFINFEYLIQRLKGIVFNGDKLTFEFNVNQRFRYVIDANIVNNL